MLLAIKILLLLVVDFTLARHNHATTGSRCDLNSCIRGKPNTQALPNELSISCQWTSLPSCLQCSKMSPFTCSVSTIEDTIGARLTGSSDHETTSATDSDFEEPPTREAAIVNVFRYSSPNVRHIFSQLLEAILLYCFGTADRSSVCRFCAQSIQDEVLFRVSLSAHRLESICSPSLYSLE